MVTQSHLKWYHSVDRDIIIIDIMPKLPILYTHRHTCITVTVDITANP